MPKDVQEGHGRASWLASREISRLELAGLRERGCQTVVLPHVGPGLVGSEWLQECQASQPRVARAAWLPACRVHPAFVARNNRAPFQMYSWEDGQSPGKGRECVQSCSCSASTTVSTCSTAPRAGIGPCSPGLVQSPQKPEEKSSCISERSSRGLTYCPSKAPGGNWEQEDALQKLSQLQSTLLAMKYPFTRRCS